MHGRHLDETVVNDRLMRNRNSPYGNVNFSNRDNHGNPGNLDAIGRIAGYEDVVL